MRRAIQGAVGRPCASATWCSNSPPTCMHIQAPLGDPYIQVTNLPRWTFMATAMAAEPPPKRARLASDRVAPMPSGANLIEVDGKSCTHEVAWPPGARPLGGRIVCSECQRDADISRHAARQCAGCACRRRLLPPPLPPASCLPYCLLPEKRDTSANALGPVQCLAAAAPSTPPSPPPAAGEEGSLLPPPPRAGPPAREYPFPLDPFQQTAVNALEAGHSVLVAAHTSAGKTVVAEYAFGMALRDGHKVVYTSPLKVGAAGCPAGACWGRLWD